MLAIKAVQILCQNFHQSVKQLFFSPVERCSRSAVKQNKQPFPVLVYDFSKNMPNLPDERRTFKQILLIRLYQLHQLIVSRRDNSLKQIFFIRKITVQIADSYFLQSPSSMSVRTRAPKIFSLHSAK